MNIQLLSASMRPNSQSLKIANYLKNRLEQQNVEAAVVDLQQLNLPLYTTQDIGEKQQDLDGVLGGLQNADGFVFVSPEWNGMASLGLLNIFHFADKQFAHKPVMLVGVSSGRGGSYPMLQLRTMGYKNMQFVVSPENLVITDCKNVFNNEDQDQSQPDAYLKHRADYALRVLVAYAKSLQSVRASGVIDFDTYPNGM